jgi:hypothetical protein
LALLMANKLLAQLQKPLHIFIALPDFKDFVNIMADSDIYNTNL